MNARLSNSGMSGTPCIVRPAEVCPCPRRETLIARFRELRDAKRDIYRSWNVSRLSDVRCCAVVFVRRLTSRCQRSVIVSRTALSEWLERGLAKRKRAGSDATLDGAAATDTDGTVWDGMDLDVDAKQKLAPSSADVIENTDIECWHGRLDPAKAGEMKRISEVRYSLVGHPSSDSSAGCVREDCRAYQLRLPARVYDERCLRGLCRVFVPRYVRLHLHHDKSCHLSPVVEKYYAQAHPNLVEQFDEFCKESCDEPGSVWISKGWVKGA